MKVTIYDWAIGVKSGQQGIVKMGNVALAFTVVWMKGNQIGFETHFGFN